MAKKEYYSIMVDANNKLISPSINEFLAANNEISGGSGGSINYTVNGNPPDENGNFEVNVSTTGAALAGHTHTFGEISDFETLSNDYSDVNHTHDLVTGVKVGNTVLTENVAIAAGNNVKITESAGKVKIDAVPYTYTTTQQIVDSGSQGGNVKIFTGTQSEWDNLTKDPSVTYIAMII
jgi:hypothetical protein